jgi:hypothetical protein
MSNCLNLKDNIMGMTFAIVFIERDVGYFNVLHERSMVIKFRLICPDCGASVITPFPQAVVLECCYGCSCHIWDLNDALMAEIYVPEQDASTVRDFHAEN